MRFGDFKQEYVTIKALWHAMPWKSWRYRSTNWRNTLPLSTNFKVEKANFFWNFVVFTPGYTAQYPRELWPYESIWNLRLRGITTLHSILIIIGLLQGWIKMAKTFLNEYYATLCENIQFHPRRFPSNYNKIIVLKFIYWHERVILSSNLNVFCRQDSKPVFVFERSWIRNLTRKRSTLFF